MDRTLASGYLLPLMSLYAFLKYLGSEQYDDYAWMLKGKCRDLGPEATNIMFPEKGDTAGLRRAKAVCKDCPVKRECLDFALTSREGKPFETQGIWGGTSVRERKRIKKGTIPHPNKKPL